MVHRRRMLSLLLSFLLLTAGCRRAGGPIHVDPSASAELPQPVKTEEAAETEPAQEEAEPEETDGIHLPVFSIPGGFYDKAQKLTLSLPAGTPKGSYVTYTTDGGEPIKSSKAFLGQIDVAKGEGKCTVVRAAAFDRDGNRISPIVTESYIRAGEDRFATLVVSIVTEKRNLNGATGILDHPTNSGKEWERPCHVEIFTEDGERVVSQDAGLRIFGGSSRVLPQKSFRLIARKDEYFDAEKYDGKGTFAYPFFEGRTVQAGENAGAVLDQYDRLILRNGGNDSIQATAADPTAMTLTRDAAANAFIAAHSDRIATQSSRFAAVYLNGDYYGILDMKEDVNDDYLRRVYGLEKENVTVIKSELDTTRHCDKHDNGGSCRFDGVWFYYEVDDGPEEELDAYLAMCREAADALEGDAEQRAAAYEKLRTQLDTDSIMEYAALCLYMCNTDWPHNNLRVWRYTGPADPDNPYSDGLWRFAARDMDFCFGRYQCLVLPEIYTMADTDTLSFVLGNYKDGGYKYDGNYPDSLYTQALLALCLHDDQFRAGFRDYCESLCSPESAEGLKAIMDSLAAQIEGEIPRHLDRWRSTVSGDYTPDVWKKNTEAMKTWADDRPGYFKDYLSFLDRFAS